MEIGNMKNIVVLKNLPSNMVEEAFVILKPNMTVKEVNLVKTDKRADTGRTDNVRTINPKEYVIKEAEMLISNYISSIERPKETKKIKSIEKKYKRLKSFTFLLGVVSVLGIIANLI